MALGEQNTPQHLSKENDSKRPSPSADTDLDVLRASLFEWSDPSVVLVASYVSITGGDRQALASCPLLSLIGLKERDVPAPAANLLRLLEAGKVEPDEWLTFKWRVKALYDLADMIRIPIYDQHTQDVLFDIPYLYFESRYVLIQSLLAGLSGIGLGQSLLLRLFLEFSATQNAYERTCEERKSHLKLRSFMEQRVPDKWSAALSRAVPAGPAGDAVRQVLRAFYDGISETAAHPYHPTVARRRNQTVPPRLDACLSFVPVSAILKPVIWMYALNRPLICHPCDLTKKFGYGQPAGLFADSNVANAVKMALGPEDYSELESFASTCDELDALEWYKSQPDLSAEEIDATWNLDHGVLPLSQEEARARTISAFRATLETMSIHSRPSRELSDEAEERLVEKMTTFKGWAQLRRRRRL